MMFKTLNDVSAAGYTGECGPLFRIDTIVFDNCIEDGEVSCLDAWFWENEQGTDVSPIDCFFTSIREARAYAGWVNRDMALWFKTHGNGRSFDHVAIDVLQMDWFESGRYSDWEPGYAVSTYDWMFGTDLEEWHDLGIADDRACRV